MSRRREARDISTSPDITTIPGIQTTPGPSSPNPATETTVETPARAPAAPDSCPAATASAAASAADSDYDCDDEIESVDCTLADADDTNAHAPRPHARAPFPACLRESTLLLPFPALIAELNRGGLAVPLSVASRAALDTLCDDLAGSVDEVEVRRWRFDMLILTMAHYYAVKDVADAADAYLDEKGGDSRIAFRTLVDEHVRLLRQSRPEYAACGLYP